MKILVLTGLLFAGGALAQTTTTCNSFGQTTTCRSTAAPDYSFLHDAGKQGAEAAGQGLGALLGTALPAPRVSEIVISVRCDQVESEVIYYTNGTSMNVEIEHTALSADGRATILAKVQHVRFVNMYCEAAQNSITTMADSVAPSSHVEYRGTYECAQGTTSLSLTFDTTPN